MCGRLMEFCACRCLLWTKTTEKSKKFSGIHLDALWPYLRKMESFVVVLGHQKTPKLNLLITQKMRKHRHEKLVVMAHTVF